MFYKRLIILFNFKSLGKLLNLDFVLELITNSFKDNYGGGKDFFWNK